MTLNNKNNSSLVNTKISQGSMASSSSSLTQQSYKDGFDGDIEKAKQYNQQFQSNGQSSMTSTTGSLTQQSFKDGFDGDIEKAKQYNKQMGSSGQSSITSSTNSLK